MCYSSLACFTVKFCNVWYISVNSYYYIVWWHLFSLSLHSNPSVDKAKFRLFLICSTHRLPYRNIPLSITDFINLGSYVLLNWFYAGFQSLVASRNWKRLYNHSCLSVHVCVCPSVCPFVHQHQVIFAYKSQTDDWIFMIFTYKIDINETKKLTQGQGHKVKGQGQICSYTKKLFGLWIINGWLDLAGN